MLVEEDSVGEANADVNQVSNENDYSKSEGIFRYVDVRCNRRLRRGGCRMRWASTMTNCRPTTASRPTPSACRLPTSRRRAKAARTGSGRSR